MIITPRLFETLGQIANLSRAVAFLMYENMKYDIMPVRGCKCSHCNTGKVKMFANKSVLLVLLVWGLIASGCVSKIVPTVQPEVTVASTQQQPTSAVFVGIPPIFDPLIKSENESVEEFVARIVAEDISYSRPVLIALSQLKVKSTHLYGVPSNRQDVQQCWFYEAVSNRVCTNEDLEKYFSDQTTPKIFFAFAYSTSEKSLFLIEHFYDGDEYYFTDHYRLVLEFKNGKWIEKSILPGGW